MIPTGWNHAQNNPTNEQNPVQQYFASINYSSSHLSGHGWYPNYNHSLHASSPQPSGLSTTIQRNHASNYVYPPLSTTSGVYNPSHGSPIAMTFRVLWGGSTTNLIMARPSVTIMAPKTAIFILGSSTASPSLLRDGDSYFATKLDETSSEYYYFQQLYLQDEQELGLSTSENYDSSDMFILRLPLTYLRSIIESPSSTKAIGSSTSVNPTTTPPPWLDTVSLRQQLTRSLYSYNNEISSHLNLINNTSNSNKDETLVQQVALFLEHSLSKLGDWYPSMSINHIMGLVLLSEGQLIMVARGNVATSMSLLPPFNVTRSISAGSTSSSHISDHTTKHHLNTSPTQSSISPPMNSSYLGGALTETSTYSRGFGNFIGAVGRESDVDRNMGTTLPSYDSGWANRGAVIGIGTDVQNMNRNITFGGRNETNAKDTISVSLTSSNSLLYGTYNFQDYESTDARAFIRQSDNQLSTLSGRDGAATNDFSRSFTVHTENTAVSTNNTRTASRFNNTNTSNDDHSIASSVNRSSSSRPDPTNVVPALLALGFTQRQCDAAVLAVRNAESPKLAGSNTNETIDTPTIHLNVAQYRLSDDVDVNQSYSSSIIAGSLNPAADDSSVICRPSIISGSRSILRPNKSMDSVDSDIDLSLIKASMYSLSTSANTGQPKMMKVLDIPPEMNAFIFHCNTNTRDECLDKKMFGCPSGGQYGPHSKAKAGDLLFLADFSSWTVTGIFTAKCDAGLNLDPSAWGGKFPWQIRINEWTTLRTVHIDKVNEILGLAAGSKLNMLTKDQLVKLVHSKEFGPCLPSSLYKHKSVPVEQISCATALAPQSKEGQPASPEKEGASRKMSASLSASNDDREVRAVSASGTNTPTIVSANLTNPTKPKLVQVMNSNDEHPSTAMHRSKLVTAWFDAYSGDIVVLNELYNTRRSPQKKETKREKNISDDLSKLLKSDCAEPWVALTFAQARQAVVEMFYRWLLHAHAVGNEEGRNARLLNMGKQNLNSPITMSFDDSSSWLRQGRSTSSHGKKREDPVLVTLVPGALEFVKGLLKCSGPKGLAIPTNDIAEALATKFLQELEQFSSDVRKTQISSVRVGGDNYLKSTEDKTLSIRLSEVTSKYVDRDGVPQESTVMKIEWYTKASITQGRPPQIQKLDKPSFEMLERSYREVASAVDPEKTHFLTRLFVMLCRYDLFGDALTSCQALVHPHVFLKICENFGVTHECFTTPLSRVCSSYNSIFPDTDRYFGSLGSFFDFMPTEGSFFVNPPFDSDIKMTLDHINSLLQTTDNDKNALSFLVFLRNTTDLLPLLDNSSFLRKKTSVNFSDQGGRYILIWLQNDFGFDLWTPTDARIQSLVNAFTQSTFS